MWALVIESGESPAGIMHCSYSGPHDYTPFRDQKIAAIAALRIAFVTTTDVADVTQFSGVSRFMFDAMAASGLDLVQVGPLDVPWRLFWGTKKVYIRKLRRLNYQSEREPVVLRDFARQVEKLLSKARVDLVFSPGTIPIALLDSDLPIAFWTDAPFDALVNWYPNFSRLCRSTALHGSWMEQEALSRAAVAIYSSEWAATEAVRRYAVDPDRVAVVPFGANLSDVPASNVVREWIAGRSQSTCWLIFIGVEWARKGGPIALEVARLLRASGIDARLTIIGAAPSGPLPKFAEYLGFLSKGSAAGAKRIAAELARAHFLVLPTRADCVPVVLAEACAYGVPSVATRVGGVGTAIIHGETGFTPELADGPDAYAELIASAFSDAAKYRRIAESARALYDERLNWTTAVRSAVSLLRRAVDSASVRQAGCKQL